MMQLVALGLAALGLAIPLAAIFYFADKRAKQDRARIAKGRRPQGR
ncbi:MAG: hypothetical protein PHY45_14735 [Rhodocyclaceae bacterium]|nr:hypothetical protein [Rhodocyclaceae bacterium]